MKILAKNSRATFDYDIKDTYVAGLLLSGAEVKSVKNGNVSLTGSYVTVSGSTFPLVIVPLEIYAMPRGWLKIKIGLGKARKKIDKREYIKKRESEKEIRNSI